YLYDRATGTTTLISRTGGEPLRPITGSRNPVISAGGEAIAFVQTERRFHAQGPDTISSLLSFYDRVSGTTRQVGGTSNDATVMSGSIVDYKLSADGRYLVFARPSSFIRIQGDFVLAASSAIYVFDRLA